MSTRQQKAPRKMGNDTLGRERRKNLKDRIRKIRNSRYSRNEDVPDPPAIAAARKLVDRHDDAVRKRKDKLNSEAYEAANKADSALLATDSFDEGLSIVEKLEAEAKKRGWT